MVDFRTLVPESAWNPETRFDTFLHRLSEEIKDGLAARELPLDLNALITLTIRIDGRLWECRSERRSGLVTLVHPLLLAHLRRNADIPEGCISEKIRSHPSSLGNDQRWLSQTHWSLWNWAELDYRLGNVPVG